ncbi:MAG: thermonuclease family protein [bacterium]|nr:thermonuclease family protein [bacterium]
MRRRRQGRLSGLVLGVLVVLVCLAEAAAAPVSAAAVEEIRGRVLTVLSGDTFQLLDGRDLRMIRLAGVDCPELKQDYGSQARVFTADRIGGKTVTIAVCERAPGGQIIGEVTLPGGRNLGRELVMAGLAWVRSLQRGENPLHGLEDVARTERRGLWRASNPTPPWEFRRREYETDPTAALDPIDAILARRPGEAPAVAADDTATTTVTVFKSTGGEIPSFYFGGPQPTPAPQPRQGTAMRRTGGGKSGGSSYAARRSGSASKYASTAKRRNTTARRNRAGSSR